MDLVGHTQNFGSYSERGRKQLEGLEQRCDTALHCHRITVVAI